jgi:WhiB family redox-sensing transcriptional regulator
VSTPPGALSPWAARELAATRSTRGWVEGAACAQTDPELFFPDRGKPSVEAKLVCRRCPAAAACLEFALNSPIRVQGVWGGTTEKERRELRRQQGVKTDNYYDRCGTTAGVRRHYRRSERPCADCRRAEMLARKAR